MKTLLTIISLVILSGCASQPTGQRPVYGGRNAPPADPGQWRVVSVTPVAPGTGAQLAAASGKGTSTDAAYQPSSSSPYGARPYATTTPIYVSPSVYYPQPIYLPQPVYAPVPRSYYPPLSIGLDFGFGRSWGGRGRNWGGIGIGTRWPR